MGLAQDLTFMNICMHTGVVSWYERAVIYCVKVSEVCPLSFDGNHAMLIRNHDGDFAVCTVNWLNYATFGGNCIWMFSGLCCYIVKSKFKKCMGISQ